MHSVALITFMRFWD